MGIEIKVAAAPVPGIPEARSHSNDTIGTQTEGAEGNLRGGFDFMDWMGRHREWSVTAFGPAIPGNDRRPGVVDHIRMELEEVLENPDDLEEWADIVILATDGAWRAGASPQRFVEVLEAKQTKNRARSWPDWRTVPPTRAITHVEDSSGLMDFSQATNPMSPWGRLAAVLELREGDELIDAARRIVAERDRLLGEVGDLERALGEAPTHHQTVSALALEVAEAGQILRGGESGMPNGLLELAKFRMGQRAGIPAAKDALLGDSPGWLLNMSLPELARERMRELKDVRDQLAERDEQTLVLDNLVPSPGISAPAELIAWAAEEIRHLRFESSCLQAERDRFQILAVGSGTVSTGEEHWDGEEALDLCRKDIADYQNTIAGLEAQVLDLEADLAHLRGQRAELAGVLAEVCAEATRLEVE